jgi:pantoate--beta-alanine ligase
VATVVLKLFNMATPDVAYFGQKDAQQLAVVQQLVRDLNLPVRVAAVATVREPDGLALSSRNRYLDPTQRRQAVALSQALFAARGEVAAGERNGKRLVQRMKDVIASAPDAVLDYAAVVDPAKFEPLYRLVGPAVAVIAVRFGSTRLIDNTMLNDET